MQIICCFKINVIKLNETYTTNIANLSENSTISQHYLYSVYSGDFSGSTVLERILSNHKPSVKSFNFAVKYS